VRERLGLRAQAERGERGRQESGIERARRDARNVISDREKVDHGRGDRQLGLELRELMCRRGCEGTGQL
jgi:hypothetical protein